MLQRGFPRAPSLRQQDGGVCSQVRAGHPLQEGGQGVCPGLDGSLGQSLLPGLHLRLVDVPAGHVPAGVPREVHRVPQLVLPPDEPRLPVEADGGGGRGELYEGARGRAQPAGQGGSHLAPSLHCRLHPPLLLQPVLRRVVGRHHHHLGAAPALLPLGLPAGQQGAPVPQPGLGAACSLHSHGAGQISDRRGRADGAVCCGPAVRGDAPLHARHPRQRPAGLRLPLLPVRAGGQPGVPLPGGQEADGQDLRLLRAVRPASDLCGGQPRVRDDREEVLETGPRHQQAQH